MESKKIYQWDELYPDKETLLRDIERSEMRVLSTQTRVVACITLNTEESPEYRTVQWRHAGPALVVHRLTVDPAWQGQGFATKLMIHAERHARETQFRTLRLDAYTENPGAMALYIKLGYAKAGTVTFRKGLFNCYEKGIFPSDEKFT